VSDGGLTRNNEITGGCIDLDVVGGGAEFLGEEEE
jgi:hypothetical protein